MLWGKLQPFLSQIVYASSKDGYIPEAVDPILCAGHGFLLSEVQTRSKYLGGDFVRNKLFACNPRVYRLGFAAFTTRCLESKGSVHPGTSQLPTVLETFFRLSGVGHSFLQHIV